MHILKKGVQVEILVVLNNFWLLDAAADKE